MLWPPDAKGWLTGKDPDAGKDWGQEEKGTTEDEMARCHHQLNGHGFGWTLGVGDGQGGLVCCSPWGHKESDTTEPLNWTEYILIFCPSFFHWKHNAVDREGNGTPLQYSCLENPMGVGAWWAAAHGVTKSWTRLSNVTFTFHFHALEKEMATHSSVLAWRIPGTGEPGGLPSVGSGSRTRLKRLSSSSIPFYVTVCFSNFPFDDIWIISTWGLL